jgi:NAD(P)-dependent dehydrogenase (short-subunit alcohol dehydrogenase family)
MGAAVALVTGGSRGIGRETVAGLAGHGMTALIGARDVGRAEAVAGQLRSGGADVRVVGLDVADPTAPAAAAGWIEDQVGRLDVLVNNAGISGDHAGQVPGTADLGLVRAVFDTNVFGVIAVTEAMLPLLRRSAAPRIVNVSSGVGSLNRMSDPADYLHGLPGSLAYSPSKAALNQVTVQYAKALRPAGFLVNAADPGPCATDFTAGLPGLTRSAADGAAVVIGLATLSDGGPTGGFYADAGEVPW